MTDTSNTISVASVPDRAEIPVGRVSRSAWLLAWVTAVSLSLIVVGLVGWAGVREFRKQQGALRTMREAVEQSLAPGEMVVVDDRLLAWALRGGPTGELRQSVLAVSEDVSVSSLLAKMEAAKRREMLVVANPEDRLIQHLDAAGFSVAQEVGWVPWDVKGNGWVLLGRGKMRIYFAVVPQGVVDAEHSATDKGRVISSKGSGVQR